MSRWLKISLVVCLAAAGFFSLFKHTSPQPINATTPTKGAIYFEGKTVLGDSFSLSDYQGKIIIVDFWATWCPPCVAEIPHFIALQETYKESVQIVGISVDESKEKIHPFMKKHGISYPILHATPEIAAQFDEISGIPTTFTLDQHHNIVDKAVGYRDYTYFSALIKRLTQP